MMINSCRCVIDVMLLDCVCCTRLIKTRITVCSVRFLLHLPEFDIPLRWRQLNHYSLKYQDEERSNLQDDSCQHRLEYGMTFPTLCLTPERWMGLRVESTLGWPWVLFSSVLRLAGACGVATVYFIYGISAPHMWYICTSYAVYLHLVNEISVPRPW